MMHKKPNVIYIYADDLGRGLLSCYGQKQFSTPNIDKLASQGIKFNRAYGSAFCAPARASLLCGIHDAHPGEWTFTRAGIYKEISRGTMTEDEVYEIIQNTGLLPEKDTLLLPRLFKNAGYKTCQIGKLEWGFATTPQQLFDHGWDYHYGYYDHERCHGFYPDFLFDNGVKFNIPGNTGIHCGRGTKLKEDDSKVDRCDKGRAVYSQDLFDDKIIAFLRENKDNPFFLFHPSQLPHGPVYAHEIYEDIRSNPDLNDIEIEFACMVRRLDITVGKIMDELEELGIADDTMVIFSSDNGYTVDHCCTGGASKTYTKDGVKLDDITVKFTSALCNDVFDADTGLSGLKCSNWEGGVTIPYIVKWPGVVEPNRETDHMMVNYDLMATIADLLDVELPDDKDGISYLPLLEGRKAQEHDTIPFASFMGPSIVSKDGLKLRIVVDWEKYRYSQFGGSNKLKEAFTYQLFNVLDDTYEVNDLSDQYPEKVNRLRTILHKECGGNLAHGTPQMHFAFYGNEYFQFDDDKTYAY